MVTQTARATARTPPWPSSSADPAGSLRPSGAPSGHATRQYAVPAPATLGRRPWQRAHLLQDGASVRTNVEETGVAK